jgi:Tfp pilus assembly PilM family ATPase
MIPSGGRDITHAVASGLGVADEIAERLKRGDLSEPVVDELEPANPEATTYADVRAAPAPPDPERVRDLALARAGGLVDEVRSTLEFYAAQVPSQRIGRVLVVGGGSSLDGFVEALQDQIPAPVDRGRLFERVKSELDLPVDAAVEAEAVLPVAVGLAIPGKKRA